MSISKIISENPSPSDQYWKIPFVASAIGLALSIIAVTALLVTMGANYYVYGAAAFGVLSLAGMAVSYCKPCAIAPSSDAVAPAEETPEVTLIQTDKQADEVTLKEITLTLDHFDPKDFKKWIMGRKQSDQKKELLEHTVLKALEMQDLKGPISFTFYQAIQSKEAFEALLKSSFNHPVSIEKQKRWFLYTHQGHTHIDFANAFIFGGGWRDEGNVQEERMFCEFFILALLGYISAKHGTMIRPANGAPELAGTEPTPFIIPNARRDFSIDSKIYGRALYSVRPEEIQEFIRPAPANTQPVTITGIAARCWRSSTVPNRYSRHDLVYHLKAAYLAFMGEKILNPDDPIVITGAWGCGAFGNSEMMITALQLLAAKMAGVKLIFSGTNSSSMANYTNEKIEALHQWINSEENPEAVLTKLLDNQQNNPADWAPKV